MLRLYVEEDRADSPSSICPEVALLITTYQQPRHLRLVLASVAMQQGVAGKLEVVIVDDGSTDETFEVAERFARSVDFPVRLTTHPHRGYQVAHCRNEGVLASTAPYIIYLDGDCLVRPDFVAQHLRRRKRHIVMNGDCFRLDEANSAKIDESAVRSGTYTQWISRDEHERLRRCHRRSFWQNFLRHPRKPSLLGNNIGMWREDLERINGWDEEYVGWGGEDDDFGYRLRQCGIRIKSIRRWTPTYHIWHPRHSTWMPDWRDGVNAARLMRSTPQARCPNGLLKLDEADSAGPVILRASAGETRIIDLTDRAVAGRTNHRRRLAA